MSVPAAYETAIARHDRGALVCWVEIEGLPYAYGNTAKDSTWFASRATDEQFSGIRAWFPNGSIPSLPGQEFDHLDGAVSGGAMVFRVEDVDGSLTELTAAARTDNRLAFTDGVNASATVSTNVNGDTTGWASSGVGYVDFETFAYSAKSSTTLTLSGRGRYRSRGVAHAGGQVSVDVAASNSTATPLPGELVTPYPRKLEGRRVWLYVGHAPSAIGDCVALWSGVIEEVSFTGPALNVLEVSCSQAMGELREGLFRDLGTFGLGVVDDAAVPQYVVAYRATQDNNNTSEIRDPSFDPDLVGQFTDGETYIFGVEGTQRTLTAADTQSGDKRRTFLAADGSLYRLGDDFTLDEAGVAVYRTPLQTRRTFDYSGAAGGSIGSPIRECLVIASDVGPFSGAAHPLAVLLRVLISDAGDGTNGAYDVLPTGFGLGLDASRVAVADIIDLIAQTPEFECRFIVTDPVDDAGEWIRERLLKPFGFYLRASLGDQITVGRLLPPTPDEIAAAPTLAHGDVLSYGSWRSDVDSVIGKVAVIEREFIGPNLAPEPFKRITTVLQRDGRIILLDHPKARTVEYPGFAGFGYLPGARRVAIFRALLAQLAARFSEPVALLDLTVGLAFATLECGDFVSFTSAFVPSRYAAARGVSSQLWEVVGKRVSLRDCTVSLTLRQTAVAGLRTRYLAPAMLVDSVSGPDVTIDQTAYVASGQDATDAFAVGDVVRGYSVDDLSARTTARTISGISGAVVTLDSAASIGSGAVLLHADFLDWDTSASTAASVCAFRGATDATLTAPGPISEAAHEHA